MPARTGSEQNSRITLAVLSTKLDAVIENQVSLCQKLDRLAQLQSSDHDRIGAVEGEIRRLNDKVNAWQAVQAAISAGLAAVLAWIKMAGK